jgi:hypothetical protein
VELSKVTSKAQGQIKWAGISSQPTDCFSKLILEVDEHSVELGKQLTALASYSLDSNQLDCLAGALLQPRSDDATLTPFKLFLLATHALKPLSSETVVPAIPASPGLALQ